MIDSLIITAIGMGSVFLFLVLLLYSTTLMNIIVAKFDRWLDADLQSGISGQGLDSKTASQSTSLTESQLKHIAETLFRQPSLQAMIRKVSEE